MMDINSQLIKKMQELAIDIGLTTQILDNYNQGKYDKYQSIIVHSLPQIDGKVVIDLRGKITFCFGLEQTKKQLAELGVGCPLDRIARIEGDTICFNKKSLSILGYCLYPKVAYGILNGGSASSYIDLKKNKGFDATLFGIYEQEFELLKSICQNKAKGLTPAYLNQDLSPGPSFIELKLRALLIEILRYKHFFPQKALLSIPMFQMTSILNHNQMEAAYRAYRESAFVKDLIEETGYNLLDVRSGIQSLLAAFSHSKDGRVKTIFNRAGGKQNTPLPMPGGHGQSFYVLRDVYNQLYKEGIRFIFLGNVDNLGFTINPVAIALFTLFGKHAAFEFALRTQVDVKGGILIKDQNNKLNCVDIGLAIDKAHILKAEAEGKEILFNCAIGLFDLEYIVNNLDYIIENLPVRFSDQDKDSGRYSQAEQVTWEVMGLLDKMLIFVVDKYDRFLAAKIILENLMTSGLKLDHPHYPVNQDPVKNLKAIAQKLHNGLVYKLNTVYGMKQLKGCWVPKSVAELKSDLKKSLK